MSSLLPSSNDLFRTEFDYSDWIDEGTYLKDYFIHQRKHFPSNGLPSTIYTTDLQYAKDLAKIGKRKKIETYFSISLSLSLSLSLNFSLSHTHFVRPSCVRLNIRPSSTSCCVDRSFSLEPGKLLKNKIINKCSRTENKCLYHLYEMNEVILFRGAIGAQRRV